MPRGCSAVRSSGPEERWQQAANATLFRSRRGTLKHLTGLAPGEVWRYLTASMILFKAVVGGFSFDVTVLSDRSKTIHGAPAGERTEWKERIAAIVPSDPRDEDLARLLLEQARTFTRYYYYVKETGDASRSFETVDTAGSLDVLETLEAASSDLVSVHIGENSYEAGMAHSNSNAFLNIM